MKTLKAILAWCRRNLWRHHYVYHNPYDRTCKVCGRHEVEYCQSMDTWQYGWWEAHSDGTPEKHWEKTDATDS